MYIFWLMDAGPRWPGFSKKRLRCSITRERLLVESDQPIEIRLREITECGHRNRELYGGFPVGIVSSTFSQEIFLLPVNPLSPYEGYQDETYALIKVIEALRQGEPCDEIENPYLRQLEKKHKKPPEGVVLDPDQPPGTYFNLLHPHYVRDSLISVAIFIIAMISMLLIIAALFGGISVTIQF